VPQLLDTPVRVIPADIGRAKINCKWGRPSWVALFHQNCLLVFCQESHVLMF
jgi:hypothetical protein